MAKRNNNSLGRRTYGGKPYDANNSFVKKMATKVTDLIPQRSWISKWFNAAQDNGDAPNEDDILADADEIQQPPAKRPRIRMDITHPPGTFSIKPRDKDSAKNHDSQITDETEDYFLEPVVAGPSGACKFVSSTPAVHSDARNLNSQRGGPLSHLQSGNNGASNGTDDNSESGESTSGCSSLIPQTNRQEGAPNSNYGTTLAGGRNRFIDDKSSFTNHLQSPRCLFLGSGGGRDSSASRRPSFNASLMNTDGNNLDRSSSLSSPFYSGNVTFGGANALGSYKRSRSLFNSTNEFQLKIPRRTRVEVKPSNGESVDASGMSQTAKRILEAMEYFSSPISDAKKIPVKRMPETPGGTKRSRDERSLSSLPTARVGLRHLTRELAVPTVPDMLKLRRRQRLQDTTVAARKIISAMSGPAPGSSSTTTITTAPVTATGTVSSEDYHLRTELDECPKYHGKLRGTSKKNPDDEGPAPSVNLPNITLAITSLPNFEPLPKYTKPTITKANTSEGNVTDDDRYKFASPINITEASWNLKSINNFSFSKPINANDSTELKIDRNTATASTASKLSTNDSIQDRPATNFEWVGSSTAPRLKAKRKQRDDKIEDAASINANVTAVKELTKLKTESEVKDSRISPTFATEFTSDRDIWECSECYIKNDPSEKTCVACKTPKPRVSGNNEISVLSSPTTNDSGTRKAAQGSKNISTNASFGSQFKFNIKQWECKSCLVKNTTMSITCTSCSSPKPAENTKTIDDSMSIASKAPARYDLAEKFKPAEGSWECPGCMLRNPSSVITCPCCSATKPNLGKSNAKETSRLEEESTESNKNSGSRDVQVENTIMDKFKPAASSWECSSCLVRNSETSSSCVCCSSPKPGVASKSVKETAPAANIQSGWGDRFKKPEGSWSCDSCMLQNKSEANECVACNALKPGATAKSQATASSQFSFGVPADNQSFKFGIDKAELKTNWSSNSAVTNGFDFGAKAAQTNADPGQFTFGIPKEAEKKNETPSKAPAVPTGGFVFASPKSPKDNNSRIEANNSNDVSIDSTKSAVEEKKNSTTFLFGMPKSANKRPESFAEESKKDETEVSNKSNSDNSPSFVFGVPKTDDNPSSDNKSRFDAPASDKASIFGKSSQTTVSTETKSIAETRSETPAASVTSPSTNISAPARTPFTFSELNPKIASQTPATTPSFGQTSVAPSTFSITGTPSGLGANSDSRENVNKPVASNFGIHSSVTPSTGFGVVQNSTATTTHVDTTAVDVKTCFAPAEKTKSSFFGIPGDNKPPAVFGAPVEKKNQIFGAPENKLPPVFGSSDKPQISSNTMFNSTPTSASFGGNATGTTQSVFGSTNTPVFGGNTATPSFGSCGNVGASNMFASGGKTNVNSAPTSNPGLFTFGANNQQMTPSQSTPGTFSFGAETGDSTSSAPKTIFSFGNSGGSSQSNPNECFGGSGTSNATFGTPASTNPTPSPFAFNAPAPKQDPPAFGQTSSTIPNMFGTQPASSAMGQSSAPPPFATNAATPSTGFSFGSTPSSTISGGFNFSGAMTQPAAPSSGGFNFNAPSPTPTIAFDPNTRPTFNFTGGTAPAVFNATPQPVTARRIKKAVRRMQQR